jgi:hypothetical protein
MLTELVPVQPFASVTVKVYVSEVVALLLLAEAVFAFVRPGLGAQL